MAFYKLCDCGVKNTFEHPGLAPRKCKNCGRSLLQISAVNEDLEEEQEERVEETFAEDLSPDRFYYSLDALDGSGSIVIPPSGGIVGRNALGAEILAKDLAVSREHIKVTYRGRIGLIIEDISRYGTYINDGKMVKGTRRFVREGDIIRLYDFKLAVRRHEED